MINSVAGTLRVLGLAVVAIGLLHPTQASAQNISTVAGNGTPGFSGDGGPALSASIRQTYGVAVDTAGNRYIADIYNHRIRKVSPAGVISTVVGTGAEGFSGDGGPATSALINYTYKLGVDAAGNLHARQAALGWDTPAWLSGSHVDTVPHGGDFDGVTGVVAPLEVLRAAREDGVNRLPLELVVWAEEEGPTFGAGMLGSRAYTGELHADDLGRLRNGDGQSSATHRESDRGRNPEQRQFGCGAESGCQCASVRDRRPVVL
jgi:hypothetical protein